MAGYQFNVFDKFLFKQLWVADNITQAKQRLIQQWGEQNNIKVIFFVQRWCVFPVLSISNTG